MIKLVVIFALSFLGTNIFKHYDGRPTDPYFNQYVETFERLTNTKVVSKINFKKLDGTAVASCTTAKIFVIGDIINYIYVDPDDWVLMTPEQRTLLMWHEFGHCVLGLGHNDKIDSSTGCPLSLMNSILINKTCADTYFNKYLNQFIGEVNEKRKTGR